MITVNYTVDGITKSEHFPNNKKGNNASIKFLQQLHNEWVNHPWYYRLKKIESIKEKLEDLKYKHTKKKIPVGK